MKHYQIHVADAEYSSSENINISKVESLDFKLVNILSKDHLHGNVDLDRSRGTRFTLCFNIV